MTEFELVKTTVGRFETAEEIVIANVASIGRCIDLIIYDNDVLTAVEFKLKDWRRAIGQAKNHLVIVDYSYICLPDRQIPATLKRELDLTGIGLFIFDEKKQNPLIKSISAKRSRLTWKPLRAQLINSVVERKRSGDLL